MLNKTKFYFMSVGLRLARKLNASSSSRTSVVKHHDDEKDEDDRLMQHPELLSETIDSPCRGVFLSSARAAADINKLHELGITLIVTAARSLIRNWQDRVDDYYDHDNNERISGNTHCKNETIENSALVLDVTAETKETRCLEFFEIALARYQLHRQKKVGKNQLGTTNEVEEVASATAAASTTMQERYSKNPISIFRIGIALDDNANQNIKPVIRPFAWFLNQILSATRTTTETNDNKVLVHCVQGVSRSVALVAGYMMFATCHQSGAAAPRPLQDVAAEIAAVRPIAAVNPCFGAQLFSLWMHSSSSSVKNEKTCNAS